MCIRDRGQPGQPGGNGGDWGEAGGSQGGAAGRAVAGSKYEVKPNNGDIKVIY